jgi:hypothetical protein
MGSQWDIAENTDRFLTQQFPMKAIW